jgi:hypothetical protein
VEAPPEKTLAALEAFGATAADGEGGATGSLGRPQHQHVATGRRLGNHQCQRIRQQQYYGVLWTPQTLTFYYNERNDEDRLHSSVLEQLQHTRRRPPDSRPRRFPASRRQPQGLRSGTFSACDPKVSASELRLARSPRLTAADFRFMAQPPLPHRAPQLRRSFPCSHTDFADAYPVSSRKVCFIQAMRRHTKTGPLPGPSREGVQQINVINSDGCAPHRLTAGTQHSNTARRERR